MAERRRWRREPQDAGHAAARLLRRLRPHGGEGRLAALQEAWVRSARAPEDAIPIRLSTAGVLTVACASAGVAQAVAMDADALVAELAAAAPPGGALRLRPVVADHVLARPRPPAPPEPPDPTPVERARAEEIAAEVGDPRLRELIARAAAARIALERRDPGQEKGNRRGSRRGG